MTLTRSARFAAVVLASALLAGCAAQAETLGASKIALAGGGIEITAAPLPEAAFTACADKIAGDKAAKAAKAAAIAAANRKARAVKVARAAAKRAASGSSGGSWRISCSRCGIIITVHGRSGTRGKCPNCGTPYVAYRLKALRPPSAMIHLPPFFPPGTF